MATVAKLTVAALLVASVARADDDRLVTDWPEPNRTPPFFQTSHIGVAVKGGFDAAEGRMGVGVLRDFHSGLEAELGVGRGGAYGPSMSATARWGLPLGSSVRLGLALGTTITLVPQMERDLGAPDVAGFVHPSLYVDVVIARHLLLRYASGAEIMLEPSTFADVPCASVLGRPLPASGCKLNVAVNGEIAWLFDL
jgi:hypothetical protein